MDPKTKQAWDQQNRHPGDREALFKAVHEVVGGTRALYPGSWVDIALSVAYPHATYVDQDKRAIAFFADDDGLMQIRRELRIPDTSSIEFIAADYYDLDQLDIASFDLLVSLYAGLVSEACTSYLRVGGQLLAVTSHGDVAMASIDPRYQLTGVVHARSGRYTITKDDLEEYLVPKKDIAITAESIKEQGRGLAYTKPAFAYLFTRIV